MCRRDIVGCSIRGMISVAWHPRDWCSKGPLRCSRGPGSGVEEKEASRQQSSTDAVGRVILVGGSAGRPVWLYVWTWLLKPSAFQHD